jgi:hypothetical protein
MALPRMCTIYLISEEAAAIADMVMHCLAQVLPSMAASSAAAHAPTAAHHPFLRATTAIPNAAFHLRRSRTSSARIGLSLPGGLILALRANLGTRKFLHAQVERKA